MHTTRFRVVLATALACVPSLDAQSNDAALRHAKAILRASPLVDGHNDLPIVIRRAGQPPADVDAYDIAGRGLHETDIPRLREGGVGVQFWSVYVPSDLTPLAAMRAQLEQIDIARRLIAKYPRDLGFAASVADIERQRARGRIASLLGAEGGHTIVNSLGALRAYYDLGVRYMTLTHNNGTDWADAALDSARHGGLTPFGREVVREMNRLGMMVDISHVSPATMSAVLSITEAPVIFSHSSARALVDHARNVPDSILRRLSANGGIVMANFYPAFVSDSVRRWRDGLQSALTAAGSDSARARNEYEREKGPLPRATLKDVADHVEHLRRMAGVDHVGIGADFYGPPGEREHVVGLEDVSMYPNLFAELIRRGWSDDDLGKLARGNLLRVFRSVEQVATRLQGRRPASTATIEALDGVGRPPVSGQAPARAVRARIDSLIEDFLIKAPAASAAVAVVRGHDTLVMRGYGLADREAGRAATPSTVYEIASNTKQMTAAAIMRLVERGAIGLDDEVSKHVNGLPLHGRHVTVRQLLNHTSGIPNYTASPGWRLKDAQDFTPEQLIGLAARDSLDFEPGTHYSYGNTGYVALGLIIERASGKSYGAFLADEFFKPLGLKETRYCPLNGGDATFARAYAVKDSALVPAPKFSLTHAYSAGSVCSSVRDMLVWQRALSGGRVVSARSYALMTTPDTLLNGMPTTYGLGLFVEELGPHHMITHTGSITGFTSSMLYFPAETLSVIVLTNTDQRGPEPLALNIARVLFGMPLQARTPRPASLALPPAERDRLLGTYDLIRPDRRTLPLTIFVNGTALMAAADGLGPGASPVLYYGNHVFGMPFDPALRMTFVEDGGVVSRVRLVSNGYSMEGRRRP